MENFQDRGVWIRIWSLKNAWIRIRFVLRGSIRIRSISDRNPWRMTSEEYLVEELFDIYGMYSTVGHLHGK